jgi:hypothetical protein
MMTSGARRTGVNHSRGKRDVVVWTGERLRFHLGHFRERLGEYYYG